MSEQLLFLIVGGLTVVAAIAMLLSSNAVHSALFLVTTMGGIAFLFLLLNAPFLAMIQITVYAGAIMVLFLFVIMLLGAETADRSGMTGPGQRRWFAPLALTLGLSLLFAAGAAIISSRIDLEQTPQVAPRVRVVNASAVSALTITANGVPLAQNLNFGAVSDYTPLLQGQTLLTLGTTDIPLAATDLQPNTNLTLVVYGEESTPQLAVLTDDITALPIRREARFSVFNAYNGAPSISMVDPGSEFADDDTRVWVAGLTPGALSPVSTLPEGKVNYEFVPDDQEGTRLYRLRDYTFVRDTATLFILASEPLFDGSTRQTVIPVVSRVASSFGSPETIGFLLFTDYLMPFLLLAMLLLAAMVGVIVLTHRELDESKRKPNARRKVSRPLTSVIAAQVGHEETEIVPAVPSEAGSD